MNHRHLLPDEIDLLLDDEVGFGVTPLRAHIRECAQCRTLVDEARVAVDALEAVPHFAPSHLFADRVMGQVPVFVPWHVAARDAAERWLPQARRTRFIVAGLATSVASLVTIGILWVMTQTDALVLATGAAGDQLRSVAMDAGRSALASIFGEQAAQFVQSMGTAGIAAAVVVLVLATAGSVAGFRALALASSRRRA
jgi:hypothetical protein